MSLAQRKSNSRCRIQRRYNTSVENAHNGSDEKPLKTPHKLPGEYGHVADVDMTPGTQDCKVLLKRDSAFKVSRKLRDLQNIREDDEQEEEVEDSISWSDSSDDDSTMMKVLQRQRKINEKKQALVKKLAIVEMKKEISVESIRRRPTFPRPKLKQASKPKFPVRKSMRLLRKDTAEVDLPPEPVELVERNPRKPGIEFFMEAVGFDKESMDESEPDDRESVADYNDFMMHVSHKVGCADIPKCEPMDPKMQWFQDKLRKLKITEDHAQKVVTGRIFSLALHPSNERILVAAGDKYGNLGLWDPERKDSNGGAYQFNPHIKPISCLKFSPENPQKLFMCSYDGQLRCMNLENKVFEKALVDDDETPMSSFDFLESTECMVVSSSSGDVHVIDVRQGNMEKQSSFEAHKRPAKCVSVHPTHKQYIATSCNNGSVHIFDLRKVSKTGGYSKPVIDITDHSRSVSSAYFSPITGKHLLTTSYDDRIRLFGTSVIASDKVSLISSCHHNNNTGRWLSSFRACWHPSREDAFVVGSMQRPRKIDIMDDSAHYLHVLSDSEILTTVSAVNCFHPHSNILAGGNASGKVHVFVE